MCIDRDMFGLLLRLLLQVRDITLDDAGVALAVEAVKLNDPYYPKPLKNSEEERHAWKAFVISYIENATTILQQARQKDNTIGVEVLHDLLL